MSLIYIINKTCEKLGFDAVNDRALLISKINTACKEVYEFTDLPGSLREITAIVPASSVIALPFYVGELRAMRSHYSFQKIPLIELSMPKYAYMPWKSTWNNWRIMKKSPICKSISNAIYPIVLTMENAESEDVTVTITGQTQEANRTSETVIFLAGETQVECGKLFTDIFDIVKSSPNNQNITLTAVDQSSLEFTLAIIPNDHLQALYTIVDVSALPFIGDQGTADRYVDVLYKEPLYQLQDDNEEFVCTGFDDAIVAKVCEQWYSELDGGENQAIAWYAKCSDLISKRINHTNGSSEKEIQFAPNGFLGLYPRGWYRGRYGVGNILPR